MKQDLKEIVDILKDLGVDKDKLIEALLEALRSKAHDPYPAIPWKLPEYPQYPPYWENPYYVPSVWYQSEDIASAISHYIQ